LGVAISTVVNSDSDSGERSSNGGDGAYQGAVGLLSPRATAGLDEVHLD